jgi:hypothetical protein
LALRIAKLLPQMAKNTSGQVRSVAIRGTVILFLVMRCLNTADCHNPWHTFERGAEQVCEIQLLTFYIESPPVLCVISFLRAAVQV